MNIEELEQAHEAAKSALRRVEREHGEKLYLLLKQADKQISEQVDAEFADRFKTVRDEFRAADIKLTAALDERAKAGVGAPLPIGTKLVEWRKRYSWQERKERTGRLGVIEGVTSESVHPGNMSKSSRANVGDYIVRHLKKDGTPATTYEYYSERSWYQEGVDPNSVQS